MQGGSLRSAAPVLATCFALVANIAQTPASAQPEPSFQGAIARFNVPSPPAYRAFRRLEGGLTGSSRQAWLEVWTEFAPGRGLTFEVVREGGHEYVRNKVLRNLLESEQELLAQRKPLRAPLVPGNYQFDDGGMIESGLQRVTLTPIKKSHGIVRGTLLLDRENGALVQIEGRLQKSPSFWLRDVDVTWKYANFGGHDLPVEMISSGRVRLFGRSTFKMTYEYASIEGRPISGALKTMAPEQRQ